MIITWFRAVVQREADMQVCFVCFWGCSNDDIIHISGGARTEAKTEPVNNDRSKQRQEPYLKLNCGKVTDLIVPEERDGLAEELNLSNVSFVNNNNNHHHQD